MVSGYRRPTNGTYISSSFQDHKNRRPPSGEPGTDYGVAYGTPLYAVDAGRVSDLSLSAAGGTGRFITLDLDDGRRTRSLHLSRILVKAGDRVTRGQHIGYTGASAWGKDWGVGAHVHQTLFPSHAYNWGGVLDFELFLGGAAPAGGGTRGGYADGSAELRSFQEKLIRMGHDLGPGGADAQYGEKTKAATLHEQSMAAKNGYPAGALAQDGLPGPSTNSYLDWWLTGRHVSPFQNRATVAALGNLPNKRGLQKIAKLYGYDGALDNIWGAGSVSGMQKFLDHNYGGSLPQWLRVKYGYVGDDVWGPVMAAAATRADTANWKSL